MDLANGDLLDAQVHLWNHIFNFINSMSLKCSVQLGIPDIIHSHGQPMTLPELVSALPIHPEKAQYVYRLMRILVHSGFFAMQGGQGIEQEESYTLTNSSLLLVKDNPLNSIPFLLTSVDPVFTKPWHYLSAWFQADVPTPFEIAHGRTFWDYIGKDTALNNFFNHNMATDSRLIARELVNKCKGSFKGLNSLVDVGGGTGTVAKAIADAFPHMNCTVFDRPHVVADLQGSKNLNYIGGDMFEAIPPADAVLLKWILHDWSDEECVNILKKCKEAIPSKENGGKVIIIDMIVKNQKDDKLSTETQLFFDMIMMVSVSGRERNEKELEKLFLEAGFSGYEITAKLGLRSLIEVYP